MLTNQQLNFISSLPEEYKQKAREVLELTQNSWYSMMTVASNTMEERNKLAVKLKAKYNRRLENVALSILSGAMAASGHAYIDSIENARDFYLGLVKNSTKLAKEFIEEIDNANS